VAVVTGPKNAGRTFANGIAGPPSSLFPQAVSVETENAKQMARVRPLHTPRGELRNMFIS
ncbi:MAG TPA: hypothetical protein VJU53_03685, partial [Burkholderiaceae bacterium]|nr:hypothetical protein [Burkholderiaceae bacterium]